MSEILIGVAGRGSALGFRTGRLSLGLTLILAFSLPAVSAGSQTPIAPATAPTDLLVSVMSYRWGFIERTIPYHPCALFRVMSVPSDYNGAIAAKARPIMATLETAGCLAASIPRDFPASDTKASFALFDSVQVRDSVATVFLSVQQGGYRHREEYSAKFLSGVRRWVVESVRISKAMILD